MKNIRIKEEYSEEPDMIMKFLALFNQIDKHLDKIL
jgi:hypothetical protein